MKYVYQLDSSRRYRFPTHINDLIIDRSDSITSEVFVVILNPGEAPPLHKHDDAEQVFHILEGEGVLRIGSDLEPHPVFPGRRGPHSSHGASLHSMHIGTSVALSGDRLLSGRPSGR
ncbi:MAG: cupin domain-containing protein [Terrimicrobiaceae bacterium]|nr:cupin domain-containing protein [Terrimicrobiaceae bacterium]